MPTKAVSDPGEEFCSPLSLERPGILSRFIERRKFLFHEVTYPAMTPLNALKDCENPCGGASIDKRVGLTEYLFGELGRYSREVQRCGVHAVTLASGFRAIIEDMPQVRDTQSTGDRSSRDSESVIL